jgi:ribonuclease R
VQVSRVDLDGRRIDFRLVRDGEDDALAVRTRRERHADGASASADELAALKEADRVIKAASKAKGSAGKAIRTARAAKPPSARGSAKQAKRR